MLLRACRLLPILIVIAVYVHASESAPKDWKAGSAKDSPVKDWKPRNFDSIEAGKGGYQPWCIYIYDADLKHNTNAYHYEGPKDGVLSNKDAMEKLAGFKRISGSVAQSGGQRRVADFDERGHDEGNRVRQVEGGCGAHASGGCGGSGVNQDLRRNEEGRGGEG